MKEFIEYLTTEGVRWDAVAWDCYGDPYAYPQIIADNPAYRAMATLPGGVRLQVRVIDAPPRELPPEESLPPWRRGAAA